MPGPCSLRRAWAVESAGREPAGAHQLSFLGDEDVNDLANLVSCPLDRSTGNLDVGLVHEPLIAPGRAHRIVRQRPATR